MTVKHSIKRLLFLVICINLGLNPASARPRDTYHISEADRLTESEVMEYLISLRNFAYSDDYVFRFKLKHYPPRARTITYYGTLYGHFDTISGNHFERIVIQDRDPDNPQVFITLKDVLLCRGINSHFWGLKSENDAEQVYELSAQELNQPILETVTLTYFDLLAPYLYWNDFTYLGPDQIKARPSQRFRFFSQEPENKIKAVEVSLDDEFRAILQTTAVDENETPLKSMELVSFKKTEGQYIPKTIDYRDYVNKGNKTRIDIIASAMGVTLPPELFTPDLMVDPFPAIETFVFDVF
jgi:hypothetical protein